MLFIDDKNFKLQGDLFERNDKTIDYNQNSIIALLKGPDTQYKKILMNDNELLKSPEVNKQCEDKNSFLQIHVRALNAKQQKRLLKNQHRQSIKQKEDKCLQFTFPITYPCLTKYKRNQASIISNSPISSQRSSSSFRSQLSNDISLSKSAVSISFLDDKSDDISIYDIPKRNHPSSLLHVPSKKKFTHQIRSSNACIQKHSCQLCGTILSNGICSCIVQYLLKLNNKNVDDFLVQLNDIFENLTSNNIIT